MNNYVAFFKDLKQFIIDNKLDSANHIEGASTTDIETAIGRHIDEIPAAYLAFLNVFGNNHSENAFGLDLILDSRAADLEAAQLLNADIANHPHNLIIAEKYGDRFYYIGIEKENPAVNVFIESHAHQVYADDTILFTTFIRESVMRCADARKSHEEKMASTGNAANALIDFYRGFHEEAEAIRYSFAEKIQAQEQATGLIDLATCQKQWQAFFESSSFYKQHAAHYAKFRKPYLFAARYSLFDKLKNFIG